MTAMAIRDTLPMTLRLHCIVVGYRYRGYRNNLLKPHHIYFARVLWESRTANLHSQEVSAVQAQDNFSFPGTVKATRHNIDQSQTFSQQVRRHSELLLCDDQSTTLQLERILQIFVPSCTHKMARACMTSCGGHGRFKQTTRKCGALQREQESTV